MYERIIVPLDGSKIGEAALPSVEKLVSKLTPQIKTEITLLQVLPSMTYYVAAGDASVKVPYTEKEMALIKRRAESYLQKATEEFKSKGVVVKTRVTTGSPAEEIIKVAEETKADLVAMSTHGRHGLSRWAFGSVTDKVLQAGNFPVLVVRAPKGTENI
jgi:nucleotide-binding universal stress UspA family protein